MSQFYGSPLTSTAGRTMPPRTAHRAPRTAHRAPRTAHRAPDPLGRPHLDPPAPPAPHASANDSTGLPVSGCVSTVHRTP
jgi:hypothetical protein